MSRTLTLLVASWTFGAVSVATAAETVFLNVNIVPMTSESVLAGQTVVVADGVIVAIGDVDRVPLPKGAQIVDGTDRFLLPGLAEMHAHVPDAASQDLERDFLLFAANGISIIRGMLGQPSHLQLRQALLSNERFGPRLITSGPSLNGNSVSGAADGERQVREQHARGYDFIKIHAGLSANEFAAIAATATELGMPVAGHVPESVGVENAVDAGMATIDHLDGYIAAMMPANSDQSGGYGGFFDVLLADQVVELRIAEIVRHTVAAGTWNVPTQSLFENLVGDTSIAELSSRFEMRFMPDATVLQWARAKQAQLDERGFNARIGARAIEIRRKLILALHDAGAGLLLGSDAPQVFNVPGYSLHHELRALVAAGLTPFEALQSGTTAVAEFLGSNGGIIAVGRDADLVLLDANPLDDIRNAQRIHGVALRGRWYTVAELHKRLAQIP
ncbi:MAG: amidohydrolase family protein [Gammaproteobacteria bacterium]|nr:amidohydrolase family protein [Gammaproteobacteria bacterium]